jgi:uncharacterized spore protein YtfJ
MTATDVLQKLGETFGSTATVKSVFGEPIVGHGKTVVPVAKIVYGFGGGFGAGKDSSNAARQGEGGGGGGGVRAFQPVLWRSQAAAPDSFHLSIPGGFRLHLPPVPLSAA